MVSLDAGFLFWVESVLKNILRGYFMKKLKVGIIFFIAIISCALLGTNQVAAAYSRGSRVTTSKVLRGTWYTYNYGRGLNKIKIASHTITLPFLGKQVPHGTYTLYQRDKTFLTKVLSIKSVQVSMRVIITGWHHGSIGIKGMSI